jgi:hypothetical protein
MQLMATPVGALAVSYMYPLLRETYGIVGDQAQLSSPTSRRWAGFAEILSKGFEALPPYALHALVAGAVLGVILTVLESGRSKKWVPSPTGLGIGMLVSGSVIITMFLGSVIETIWRKSSPKSCAALHDSACLGPDCRRGDPCGDRPPPRRRGPAQKIGSRRALSALTSLPPRATLLVDFGKATRLRAEAV